MQHTHYTAKFTSKIFPITLICDGVQSPSNIGSLFRLSDAMGVEKIYFAHSEININSPRLQKTARSTQKKVAFDTTDNSISILTQLKNNGYTILALEITDSSIPIETFSMEIDKKTALLIGNEQQGISEELLQMVDQTLHINMYGENSSMNVVQATSIALYAIINKLYIY